MSNQVTGRRQEILAMLREARSTLQIIEIAERLDVHPNTVRFHLDVLVDNGQVERVTAAPSGRGRPPLAFRARRVMNPAGPRDYKLLAGILADQIAAGSEPVRRATEAGRSFGAQLNGAKGQPRTLSRGRAVGQLVQVLDEFGFAPQPTRRGASSIGLRHCPFLELAQRNTAVVCSLHLGLLQGTLDGVDTPVTVERLEAFAEPDLCRVHLGTPGGAR